MTNQEIDAKLRALPISAARALAVRAGLRMLPWLALSKEKQVLTRWPRKKRDKHLLAVFFAYDIGLMAILNGQLTGLREVAQKRRSMIAVAKGAASYFEAANLFTGNAIDCGVIAASYTADASYFDEYATFGQLFKKQANIDFGADDIMQVLSLQLNQDLNILSEYNSVKFFDAPLWTGIIPATWVEQLICFQKAVRELNSGFDIWLDWYADRCKGSPIDEEQLQKRVFLPDSVLEQTPAQINAYIASLLQAKLTSPLNRVRTIFIGDGEAGKTSLIRVLNNQPVVEGIEPKTPGIEIREWKVPATEITASFWDFGGQVMVHATHQLFLRESCLYVLLVSAREKEKATERAEYWLEHVKSFGNGAPVLIVTNKADKEPVRLDEALLLEKYPTMIKGFFQLACTQAQGSYRNQFERFEAAFCQQLQAVGLHQVLFGKAHFAVLENLRQRTPQQAFLSHQDYNKLCEKNSIAKKGGLDRAWLLDILDKLGMIVHFSKMTGMEEYILNPRWLTYGIYTVMYNEQARMTRQQVETLLAAKPVQDQYGKQFRYPPGKCHIVFQAMQLYKLCYFLRHDQNQLIIPALLPSDIKQHGFDTGNALEFHYQFESFLPRHLISELIVECHEDIQSRNGEDIVWQHGVLLNNKTHGIQALIQADYHFRRLSIWLTTLPAAAEFLAILRDKVEKIVSRMTIKYTQNIRLPSAARVDQRTIPAEPEWANFRQILAQRNKGRTSYDHESGSEYGIAKILGLFEPQPASNDSTQGQIVNNSVINNVTVNNSGTIGDVNTAETMEGSFNTSTDATTPAD